MALKPARPVALSAAADAAGNATTELRPRGSYPYLVRQVSVELTTAAGAASTAASATCTVRWNGFLVTPVIPGGDAAGGDPPIQVDIGDVLSVVVAGANAGDVLKVLNLFDQIVPG